MKRRLEAPDERLDVFDPDFTDPPDVDDSTPPTIPQTPIELGTFNVAARRLNYGDIPGVRAPAVPYDENEIPQTLPIMESDNEESYPSDDVSFEDPYNDPPTLSKSYEYSSPFAREIDVDGTPSTLDISDGDPSSFSSIEFVALTPSGGQSEEDSDPSDII